MKADKKIVFDEILTTIKPDEVNALPYISDDGDPIVHTNVTMEIIKGETLTIPPYIDDIDEVAEKHNELQQQIKNLEKQRKKKVVKKKIWDNETEMIERYPELYRKQSGYGNNLKGLGNQRQNANRRNH